MTDTPETTHSGGCACGAVRFTAEGRPRRISLCHCMTCRRAHGAAFNPCVIYDRAKVHVSGPYSVWESSPGYQRSFCPKCGSRFVAFNGEEAELSIGNFDEPGLFTPQYELWVNAGNRGSRHFPCLNIKKIDLSPAHGRLPRATAPDCD